MRNGGRLTLQAPPTRDGRVVLTPPIRDGRVVLTPPTRDGRVVLTLPTRDGTVVLDSDVVCNADGSVLHRPE